MGILESVVAGLIVAAISGSVGYFIRGRRYRLAIEEAPRKYVKNLEKLIVSGLNDGNNRALINGKAIVSTRDDLRASLSTISNRLNSDIDDLASHVEKEDAIRAFDTIEVLHKKWPSKKDQIEYEIRKVLAELGLEKQ